MIEVNKMTCERKNHMKERGIDVEFYCDNCTIYEGINCTGMIQLKASIDHLSGCCMEGYPKVIEA